MSLDAFSKPLNVASNQTNARPWARPTKGRAGLSGRQTPDLQAMHGLHRASKAGLENVTGMFTCRGALKIRKRASSQACIPATLSSQYIHVLSFARFNDTSSVIENASVLTRVTFLEFPNVRSRSSSGQ